jgi:hypothetical protein
MKKLLAVAVFCLPAFGQTAYSGRGLYAGSAVYGAIVSEGGPLTYSARTDNCVHGYSTNAATVAPFYNPANETCTGAALTSISGNGSVVTVTTGTAPSGATVMIQCNSGAYTGGPFTISGDTTTFTYSSTTAGAASGCVWQAGIGEAGSPLVFQGGVSDRLPFTRLDAGTNPAVANTSFTDPDFGSYAIFATDNTTKLSTTEWMLGSSGGFDAFGTGPSNDVALILTNSGSVTFLFHVIESRFLAHTCSPATPCVILSNITGSNCTPGSTCTNTQISNSSVAFSRNHSDAPNTIFEWTGTQMYKDTITTHFSGGFPDGAGDTITRALMVDFTSDGGGSTPCSVLPSDYQQRWNGVLDFSDDDSFTMGLAGGGAWHAGTSYTTESFIMPVNNITTPTNIQNYMFQATTGGTSGSTEPNWSANCPALGNTCTGDGGVTWTNIGKVNSQGSGFDVVYFSPTRGCTHANTRLGEIYRGTNEGPNWPAPGSADTAGHWITDDAVLCYRMGGTGCGTGGTVNLSDNFTMHAAGSYGNGRYGHVDGALATTAAGVPSCTPAIPNSYLPGWPNPIWSATYNSPTGYTANINYAISPIDHNYYKKIGSGSGLSADPSADSANWSFAGNWCYNYIIDWYSNLIRPELEVGPNYGADSHSAKGYNLDFRGGTYWSHYLYQPNCQNTTAPGCAGQYVGSPNPGVQALTIPLPSDGHPSYRNNGTLDLQPIFDSRGSVGVTGGVNLQGVTGGGTGVGGYSSAGFDEIIAFSTDGLQTLYRIMHGWNTGSSPYFNVQNPIGVISQDGKMYAWASDFIDTRGDQGSGSTTCASPLISQYTPSSGHCVSLNDQLMPISNNANQSIFKITSVGTVPGSCASGQGTEGAVPSFNGCQGAGNTCTDANNVVFTNQGTNSCRSDAGLADVTAAHPAP